MTRQSSLPCSSSSNSSSSSTGNQASKQSPSSSRNPFLIDFPLLDITHNEETKPFLLARIRRINARHSSPKPSLLLRQTKPTPLRHKHAPRPRRLDSVRRKPELDTAIPRAGGVPPAIVVREHARRLEPINDPVLGLSEQVLKNRTTDNAPIAYDAQDARAETTFFVGGRERARVRGHADPVRHNVRDVAAHAQVAADVARAGLV